MMVTPRARENDKQVRPPQRKELEATMLRSIEKKAKMPGRSPRKTEKKLAEWNG